MKTLGQGKIVLVLPVSFISSCFVSVLCFYIPFHVIWCVNLFVCDYSWYFSWSQRIIYQGSSIRRVMTMQPACSNAESADSLVSCKTEPSICFARQASILSFSNLGGESNAGDYQECGASTMLLMGEPPWYHPFPETSLPSTSRSNAVLRYKEKKKIRK